MVKYPDDWKVVPLSDVGEVCMCKRVLKSETSPTGDVPFYKIGTFGKTPDAYIRRDLYEAFRRVYSYPKAGDVLISAAGTIGRTVVFDGADSYFQDSNIVWLANNEKLVGNDYLYWCYQVVNWQTEDGGIVARLYNGNFRATKIAVPPLPEQKRIAAVLGNVDKLIDNLSRQIEKKRLIKQGVIQDLLTGKKRLPGFKGEWRHMLLGDLLDYEQPQSYIVKSTEYVQDGVPVLTAGKSFILGYTNESAGIYSKLPVILFDDFLTVSRYVEFRFKVKSSAAKMLKLKDENNSLFYVFMAMQSLGYVPGDHQRHWISIFSKFEIDLPCPAEQKVIAKVLGDMDAEIAKLEAKHEKYRQLKQGLMNDLLTGKVRI